MNISNCIHPRSNMLTDPTELHLCSLVLYTKICLYSLKYTHSIRFKDQPKHDWLKEFERIMHCWCYSTASVAYRVNSRYKSTCVVWTSIMDVYITSAQLVGLPSMTVLGFSIRIKWNPGFLHYHAVTSWSRIKIKSTI